jgi:hypothetical protein
MFDIEELDDGEDGYVAISSKNKAVKLKGILDDDEEEDDFKPVARAPSLA